MTDKPLKRPESVLVLIYTSAAEVLLLRRVDDPNFWQSVTGSLEWGEDPQTAAARELFEETGIDHIAPVATGYSAEFQIRPRWQHRYRAGTSVNLEHVFLAKLAAPQAIVLSAREHSEYCWLPAADAAKKVWSYTNKDAITRWVMDECC